MKRLYLFNKFERFWHWSQSLLIIGLLLTGFEIHGSLVLLGFEEAVNLHEYLAWALIILWIFSVFWHLTTGEWKHYILTKEKLLATIQYYLVGVFKGEKHPYKATALRKHNPLQRIAYLLLHLCLLPLIWGSGLLLLFYADWEALGINLNHDIVVYAHVIAAFLMLSFLIMHLYLITTGHTLTTHLKAMLTGYEELEENKKEESASE